MSAIAGKLVLITGATGGLGVELANVFAGAGARLFLSARDAARLDALRRAIADRFPGVEAGVHAADLRQDAEVDALATSAARAGDVDVLVNNAGLFPIAPLDVTTDAVLDDCWSVNVRAPYRLCRAFAPGMAARGWGRVLNVASSSAYAGFRRTSAYCASKHALLGMSRALHDELRERGVRVVCLSPGSIDTPMGRTLTSQDPATFLDAGEVARFAGELLAQDGTMVVDEVRLNRMRPA